MSQLTRMHELPDGCVCHVPLGLGLTGFVLEEQGDWFEPELAFLRRVIRPGSACVDVGASYGVYALSMARAAGPAGVVHAFEPQSVMCEHLRRSAAALAPATCAPLHVHQCAISDRTGVRRLSESTDPEVSEFSEEGTLEVDCQPLDGALAAVGRIDLVKIDVEGHGFEVLRGATRLLADEGVIVQFVLRHAGRIQVKSCDLLQRMGFRLFRLLPKLGCLSPINVGELIDPHVINAFALRAPCEERLRREGLLSGCVTERDWPSIGLKVQDVLDRLSRAPHFASLNIDWRPNTLLSGWDHQRRAVALAHAALTGSNDLDIRIAGLMAAYGCVQQALAQARNGSRIFTLARLAHLLGRPQEATQALNQLLPALDKGGSGLQASFAEPMLLPIGEDEMLPWSGLEELVRGAAMEWLLLYSGYSMYFSRMNAPAMIEMLKGLPKRSVRCERSLNLLHQIQGKAPALIV
jgi:FkbM family methyltransferase